MSYNCKCTLNICFFVFFFGISCCLFILVFSYNHCTSMYEIIKCMYTPLFSFTKDESRIEAEARSSPVCNSVGQDLYYETQHTKSKCCSFWYQSLCHSTFHGILFLNIFHSKAFMTTIMAVSIWRHSPPKRTSNERIRKQTAHWEVYLFDEQREHIHQRREIKGEAEH